MGKVDDPDVSAIESMNKQTEAAYIADDWMRFMDFFTDDAIWMPPNEAPLIGKEAMWSWAKQWWDESTIEEMTVSYEEIVVAGDWAFERHNRTTVTVPKAGGESSTSHDKGIWLLRRQADGSWKIARYIWNTNPSPGADT